MTTTTITMTTTTMSVQSGRGRVGQTRRGERASEQSDQVSQAGKGEGKKPWGQSVGLRLPSSPSTIFEREGGESGRARPTSDSSSTQAPTPEPPTRAIAHMGILPLFRDERGGEGRVQGEGGLSVSSVFRRRSLSLSPLLPSAASTAQPARPELYHRRVAPAHAGNAP